jgi:hypothetical protein
MQSVERTVEACGDWNLDVSDDHVFLGRGISLNIRDGDIFGRLVERGRK